MTWPTAYCMYHRSWKAKLVENQISSLWRPKFVTFFRDPHHCSIFQATQVQTDTLGSCERASWAKGEERERTNKMQQSDIYYQLLSQHVSGIIIPIFRRTKTVCYSIRCTALVLLDVVGSGCGALRCRMRAVFSECLWSSPSYPYYYWYHLCFYIPHALYFYCKVFIF